MPAEDGKRLMHADLAINGGKVHLSDSAAILAPADMFWCERFAMLQDPYGDRWMLSAPLEE